MITPKEDFDLLQVSMFPATQPKSTAIYGKIARSYWQPIPHGLLIDHLIFQAERRKWKVGELKFAFNRNKSDMAASIEVFLPNLRAPKDSVFCIGILNSNYQHFRTHILGGIVYRENIGITFYERKLNKHTLKFDTRMNMNIGVSKVGKTFPRYRRMIQELENLIPAEPEKMLYRAGHTIINTWNRDVMPWKRIKRIERLYDKLYPNSWNLLVSFCKVSRSNPPILQMKQNLAFLQLLLEESVRDVGWRQKKKRS